MHNVEAGWVHVSITDQSCERLICSWLCRAEGSRGRQDGRPNQPGLAGLFEPPHEIMFKGTFEEAKAAALDQSRWLVILKNEIVHAKILASVLQTFLCHC